MNESLHIGKVEHEVRCVPNYKLTSISYLTFISQSKTMLHLHGFALGLLF